MAKTLLDLDEQLMAEAAAALGTPTKKETVTVALQRVVEAARESRAQGLTRLIAYADEGRLDFERLDDVDQ